MTIIVAAALLLALGGWLGVRWATAKHQIESDIARYVVSIPADQLDADRWRWGR